MEKESIAIAKAIQKLAEVEKEKVQVQKNLLKELEEMHKSFISFGISITKSLALR